MSHLSTYHPRNVRWFKAIFFSVFMCFIIPVIAQVENQPITLTPFDRQVITSESELRSTIFSWSGTESDFGYQLAIYAVNPCQDPLTAFRVNHPIYVSYANDEFFILQENMNFNDGTYVWSVSSGSGPDATWSPPSIFILETGNGSGLFIETGSPCDTPKGCMQIAIEKDPETEIDLKASISNADLFLYPRALPIKIEGLDYDKVTFRCKGCAAEDGTETKYYQDRVSQFDWELKGKGSLGDPFKRKKMDSLQNALDELNAKINALQDKINQNQGLIDSGIDQQIEKNKDKIKDLEKQKTSLDSIKIKLTETVDSIEIKHKETLAEITSTRETLITKLDSIRIIQERVDTLNSLLRGDFTASELQLLQEIESLTNQRNSIQAQIEQLETEFENQLKTINANIASMESTIEVATTQYNSTAERIATINQKIASLNAQLYYTPNLQDYYQARNNWISLVNAFDETYGVKNFSDVYTDVSSKAQQVLLVQANRTSLFASFISSLASFNNALQKAKSKAGSSEAEEAYQMCLNAGYSFRNKLDSISVTSVVIDGSIETQIETEKDKLATAEAELNGANKQIEQALDNHAKELAKYDEAISKQEKKFNELTASLKEVDNNRASVQKTFNDKVEARKNQTEKNKESYTTEINEKEVIKLQIKLSLKDIYTKIIRLQQDSTVEKREIKFIKYDIEIIKGQINEIDEEIKRLEQENKDLEKKKDELKKEVAKQNKELDALKKKRDELLGQLEEATKATKIAQGSYVYYIPPTMDELLKDNGKEPKFKELVKKVEIQKDSLKRALTLKENLQTEFTQMSIDIAKELLTIKAADKSLEKLNKDKAKADETAKKQEFQAGKDLKKAREDEAAQAREIEENKKKATEKVSDLEKEKESAKSTLESQKELVRKNDSLLTSILQQIQEKQDQRSDEIQNQNQRASNMADNTAKLREQKSKETKLRNEISRIQNLLSLASAKDDIAGIASNRKELNRLEGELNAVKEQVSFYVTELGIMAGKLKEIKDKIEAIDAEIKPLQEKYNRILRIQLTYREDLQKKENAYDAADANLLEAKKEEVRLQSITADSSIQKENIDSLLKKDESLQKAKKEAEDLDKKIKQLEKDKEKAKANIETIIEEKEKKEKEAKSAFDRATEQLEKEQKALKDWIDNEFNTITFETKIEFKADDAIVDEWRSDDVRTTKIVTLKYRNRQAYIDDKFKGIAHGDGKEESKCYPLLDDEKMDPPKLGGPEIGKEPRTLALLYDNGKLLYDQWPIIPDTVSGTLAKDVVIAFVGLTEDKDMLKYQCISQGESEEEKLIRLGEDATPSEGTSESSGNRPTTGSDNSTTNNESTTGTRTRDQSNGDGTRTRDNEGTETPEEPGETEEEEEDFCMSVAGLNDTIVDIGVMKFKASALIGDNASFTTNAFLWEPLDVAKTEESEPQIIGAKYEAKTIHKDDEVGTSKPHIIKAGVMIEVPDSIEGSPGGKQEITARIVRGNHKGLQAEKVRFTATSVHNNAKNFGFDENGRTTITQTTQASGYVEETMFYFGNDFDEFKIKVEWLRGGKTIAEDEIHAESPILHNYRLIAYDVNKKALDEGRKMVKSGKATTTASLARIDDKDLGNWLFYGTLKHDKTFANDIELRFEPKDKVTVDPTTAKTADFGIAMTKLKEAPKDKDFLVVSKVPDKYKDLAKEFEANGQVDNSKIESFKIGQNNSLFTILLDKEISPGKPIKGKGRISIDALSTDLAIIDVLKKLELSIEDVEVEKKGEEYIAKSGKVVYTSTDGKKFNVFSSFEFTLNSLGITASAGAVITGKVKHEKLEDAVDFEAELDPAGNFLGKLANLPEINVKDFKLKKGASVVLDMHSDRAKDVIAYKGAFFGIVIQKAELELPKSFNREGVKDPTTIGVEDFYISKEGFGGKIETKGQLLAMGFSGYELRVKEVTMVFDRNELKKGIIKGDMVLPSPMEGEVGIGITASSSEFVGELSTDKPVYLPQFKTTFVLKQASLGYDFDKEIGTLKLAALINSDKFGDVSIDGFELKSNGEVKADSIKVEKDITIGGGFTMNLRKIGFAFKDRSNYSMNFDGKVDFKGIIALDAEAEVKPGPSLTFKKLIVKFDKGPINFDGNFTYQKSVFEGKFAVKFKKCNQGLDGYVIVGNQQVSKTKSFGYWYGELSTSAKIPIAQSGFSFLEFGGGVGYNFVPPIGNAAGSPLQDGGFSVKALVGIGNAPAGQILAGRMKMSYISGRFSLYGKAWALTKEESLYGEGQINVLFGDNDPSVNGYIAAFVGLPSAEGKLFLARGKMNFSYPANNNRFVWTENVNGSLFQTIDAKAFLVISKQDVHFKGDIGYDVNKTVPLGFGKINASFDLAAELDLRYVYATSTGTARPRLEGNWDVNIDAFSKSFDVASGFIRVKNAELSISPQRASVEGYAEVNYQVLWHKGSKSIEVDYSTTL